MNGSQQTILLVEDDANDIMLIQRAFRKTNIAYALREITDGETAIAYLSGEGIFADRAQFPLPILMLLDLKLPRRSGLEVLEWLKSRPGLRRLPVVILTSSSQTLDINRAYDLGANSYLVKPVNFENLMSLLQSTHLYWTALNEGPSLGVN